MEETQLRLLWLSERLTPAIQRQVLPFLDTERFFERTALEWQELGLTEETARRLSDGNDLAACRERLKRLSALGVRIRQEREGVFPFTLPTGEWLPPILFVRGEATGWRRAGLAVVGTRKPSAYGRETATAIAREAALRGVPVVSGAAVGIDTEAHRGALEAGGITVAVLGCGLFHTYPPQAGPLLDGIAGQGAVVSQFPPDVPPDRKNFPIRNGLIAALSQSAVVVEGTLDSGARHTARQALRMGLKLFAVPGEMFRPQAQLPNRLLAEGARIVTRPSDPVDPLSEKASGRDRTPEPPGMEGLEKDSVPRVHDAAGTMKPLDIPSDSVPREEHGEPGGLERRLLARIGEGTGSVDELLREGLAEAGPLNEALLNLELRGLVRQETGRRYSLAGPRPGRMRPPKGT